MPKVMLIEDDDTMRALLGTLLQFEGYDVAQQKCDDELHEMLGSVRREEPALVLLDVNLCHFSGFDLLRSIRQDPDLKPVRVLMSSGMDHGLRCFQEGADGFILKPYMPDELMRKIRQTLED